VSGFDREIGGGGSLSSMGATTAAEDAEAAIRLAERDPGGAVPAAREAARRARRERDLPAVATAERAWGYGLFYRGDLDGAIQHLRRSVGYGEQAGSPALAGAARMTLSYALVQRGRPREAVAEIDAALLVLDGVAGARALAQRAAILHQAGRLETALTEFDAALAGLRGIDDTPGVQLTLVNRALLHTDLFAFAAAEADLHEAERLARQLGRVPAVGYIAEILALVEGLRGDVPAALAQLERAEEAITANHGPLGMLHRDRAELLLAAGLLTEARASAERAVTALRRERRLLKVPETRLLIAQAASLDGDWPAALRQAGRAAREFGRQGRGEWAELARLEGWRARLASGGRPRVPAGEVAAMVEVLSGTGWPAVALEARLVAARLRGAGEYLEQAARARRRGPAVLRARGWYAQALLREHGGDRRGAVAAARVGLRVLDEHSAAMGATDLRAHAAVHRVELVRLGLRTAMADGRPRRVFEWAERGRATQLLHRPVRPPADPALARLLAELRAAVAEVERDAGRGTARAVQRQVALERRIRDHTRQRPGARPDPRSPGPVTPAALGAALGDAALVEYLQADGTLHALTLAGGRLRLHDLGPVAAVAALQQRLPFALHRLGRATRPDSHAAAARLLADAATRLDAALLRPLPGIGDRPLVIVPTGALHSLPWSVLPSCAGRTVTLAPSATLWHSTVGQHATGGGVAVAAGPGLPGAVEEAATVAAVHGTTALTGAAATVEAVLAALGTAGTAHLATHGRLSADNPLFSSLLLADGPLYVHDLERLTRVPQTVVLAACDSGTSVVRTGDELLGLSATFVARGTANLVASVLPVPDAATATLMAAFHRGLAAGQPPAVALAAAQRDCHDGEPATVAAAAGFVCLGSA
jgi:tetratricopeptide (TPR) repeat protein